MTETEAKSVEDLVGACLFLAIDETEPGPALDRWLADLRPAGVILFARNVRDAEQVRQLNRALRGAADLPRLVGVDQEGGRVERLRPILGSLPSALELASEGEEAVHEFGRLLGAALRDLEFNLNFAPVLDLSSAAATNGIGDRAFGTHPAVVSRMARAYLEGLRAAGVLGVAKHFPGLGPTSADSHEELPHVDKSRAAFLREDLRPFRETTDLAPAIMVGHAHYRFLDDEPVAASCSRAAVTGLLRGDLGYAGAIIADDLEMRALDQGKGWLRTSTSALEAGCDMVLICKDRGRMTALRDHLVDLVRTGRFPRARLEEAAGRSAALRRRAAAIDSPAAPDAATALRDRFGRRR